MANGGSGKWPCMHHLLMDVMILTTGQIQQFQRCKLEYRAQRDKDNDVIMGEAPPLVY